MKKILGEWMLENINIDKMENRISELATDIKFICDGNLKDGSDLDKEFATGCAMMLCYASIHCYPFGITVEHIIDTSDEDIDEAIKIVAREKITQELWEKLLELVKKYSPEEFQGAAMAFEENGEKYFPITPAKNLQHQSESDQGKEFEKKIQILKMQEEIVTLKRQLVEKEYEMWKLERGKDE